MQYVSVSEAAYVLELSPSRVRQLIASGQLDAERVGDRWLVNRGSLSVRRHRPGRPMSERIAWAFLLLADGQDVRWIRRDERYRIRAKLDQLALAPDPLVVLRSWVSGRARTTFFSAPDPEGLRADPRLVASGWSDPRSRLSSNAVAEGYVHVDDIRSVELDHLLVPAARDRADAVVHVTRLQPTAPVPPLVLIADLADHLGAREQQRARDLLNEVLAQLPAGSAASPEPT